MTTDLVEIFSDGACKGNPGPGGWGARLRYRGAVSIEQLNAVRKAIDRLKSRKRGPYVDDPVYVVFAHIPYGELTGSSRDRVAAVLNDLDGKGKDLDAEPRVLAMITAHKHAALTRRHCVGNRWLREIVVGSTLDSPQQAALLEIGTNTQGRLALSVRTLQAVARPNQTCDDDHALPASRCHQVAAKLLATPACRDALSADADDSPPRDCQVLERPMSLKERLAALASFRGPRDIDDKRRLQQLEARRLLSCICRDGICDPGKEPLNGEAHAENLRQALSNEERGQELVCLAWAASACQAHKGTGMTLGEALRCAFDDPSMPPERVTVATLESAICF